MWTWAHPDSFWRPVTEASILEDSRRCWAMNILYRAISTDMGGCWEDINRVWSFHVDYVPPWVFLFVTVMVQPLSQCCDERVANGCTTWNSCPRDYSAHEDTSTLNQLPVMTRLLLPRGIAIVTAAGDHSPRAKCSVGKSPCIPLWHHQYNICF